MMKKAWWVVIRSDGSKLDGEPMEADGVSSNLSIFVSKENAVSCCK